MLYFSRCIYFLNHVHEAVYSAHFGTVPCPMSGSMVVIRFRGSLFSPIGSAPWKTSLISM